MPSKTLTLRPVRPPPCFFWGLCAWQRTQSIDIQLGSRNVGCSGLSFERSLIVHHHCISSHAPPCTLESPPFGRCRPRIASRFASMLTGSPTIPDMGHADIDASRVLPRRSGTHESPLALVTCDGSFSIAFGKRRVGFTCLYGSRFTITLSTLNL